MLFIDLILNLAGLLLWFNWRSLHFDPLASRKPATLIGTLRPASAAKVRRWMILVSLPALLIMRALLYWQIGAPADWVPRLDFGVVVLAFRVDRFEYALLYSLVSFLRVAAVAYVWLAAILIVNCKTSDPDPILKLVRLQLGKFSRAPLALQVLIPVLAIVLFWAGLHPLLVKADVLSPMGAVSRLLLQGLLVAAGVVITLKLLFPVVLLLHMLLSYVYLGNSPLWDFVSNTARSILSPMPFARLRSSKLDFAPLAAILIILLVLHTAPMLALRFAASQGVSVWPE